MSGGWIDLFRAVWKGDCPADLRPPRRAFVRCEACGELGEHVGVPIDLAKECPVHTRCLLDRPMWNRVPRPLRLVVIVQPIDPDRECRMPFAHVGPLRYAGHLPRESDGHEFTP